ncbi:MAG TPA: serine/threonine-protein kinase [Thermoanaerobaculia bacterium]|jgi:serine/threonine-protein kinase|nr:serine/threonine-protein kinase [Thermoanaerobaculia bacterium]
MIGARFGPYLMQDRVGEGGMGTVYRAEDTRTGAPVAVKVLDEARTRDPQILSRFRREARIATALRHPNIAAFHDFDEAVVPSSTGGARRRVVFLVIEWVEGEDLTAYLQRKERFGTARLAEVARQLTAALEAAHAVGVVHRDLKPSNIRLTPDDKVKVLDFGLAKILENAQLHRDHPPTFQTSIGSLLGTAPYMAPEQLFGRSVDARTDLFALGVVLYQMATGEVPFSGRNIVEVLQAVSTKAPVPPSRLDPELPAALDELILRLLAKEPEGRFASAAAVREALAAV